MGEFDVECAQPHPNIFIKLNLQRNKAMQFVAFSHRWNFHDMAGQPQIAPLIPNLSSAANQLAATIHRFGRESKPRDDVESTRFLKYAKHFIKKFKQCTPDDIPTFDEWLENSTYPGPRKKILKSIHDSSFKISEKLMVSASFQKWEGYMKPKMPRGINAYSDESKTIFGPVFKGIDKVTFKQKWFIKGMDVGERPEMMNKLFGDNPVVETDFTSFESHHRGVFSELIWFWMMHMTRALNLPSYLKRMLAVAVKGNNVTKFSCVTAHIPQTLMSGALWTSSSNGVLNLLVMSYLWSRKNNDDPELQADHAYTKFNGLIEGDDGICGSFDVDDEVITKLGIELKLEIKPHYGCASFCGIVCPPGGGSLLYNPDKFLRNFFWIPEKLFAANDKVKNTYLRAKALSYLHGFKNCPIIGPISFEICKRTAGTSLDKVASHFDSYHWETIKNAEKSVNEARKLQPEFARTPPVINDAARDHMDRIFNLGVGKQKEIEQCFANGEYVDLSERMMPWDDLHNSLHVTNLDYEKTAWLTPFRPPIIDKIMREGRLGTPINRINKTLMGSVYAH